ncbi:MAG: hypothetical protein WKG07_12235 [Hymenobacter sp.]
MPAVAAPAADTGPRLPAPPLLRAPAAARTSRRAAPVVPEQPFSDVAPPARGARPLWWQRQSLLNQSLPWLPR